MKAEEYIEQHKGEDGTLSPEAMAELLLSGDIDFDDTGEPAGDSSTPKGDEKAVEIKEQPKEPEQQPEPKEEPEKPEEPVVLAKDGKSQIPYSELESARKAEQEAKRQLEELTTRNKELQDRLAEVEEAKAEATKTGDAEEYEKLLEEIKEDFPELMTAIDKRFEMQEQRHRAELEALKTGIAEELKPLSELANRQEVEAHFDRIREAHSDLDAILAGEDLGKWIETLPEPVIDAYVQILENGTSDQVNKMLTNFKDATGYKAAAKEEKTIPPEEKKAPNVEDKISKAKEKVPLSLTDIPASGATPVDEVQALLQMDSGKLLSRFEGKTPEQIEAIISRLV